MDSRFVQEATGETVEAPGYRVQDFFDRDVAEILASSPSVLAAWYRLRWGYRGADVDGVGVVWHLWVEEGA